MRALAAPRASRRSTCSPVASDGGVAHGRPAVADDDRVAALERGLRCDRAQARDELLVALAPRLERALWRAVEHAAQAHERLPPRDDPVVGAAQRGSRRERLEPLARTHDDAFAAAARGRAQPLDVLELLASIRDDQARSVGGRRRAAVGDQVAQRNVALVPHGGDDDGRAGRDRTAEPLVRERQEILQRAAAARDHDHVDIGAGVERRQGAQDLGYRALALHGGLGEDEARRREARPRIADDVQRRGRIPARDQADAARPERRRALAAGLEEPVGIEPAPRLLDAREQRAVAGGLDAIGAQRQLRALVVERHLAVHLDALALDRPRVDALEQPAGHRHEQRCALVRIAEREERDRAVGVVAQIADLALDPQRRQVVDAARKAAIDVGDAVHAPGGRDGASAPAALTRPLVAIALSGRPGNDPASCNCRA